MLTRLIVCSTNAFRVFSLMREWNCDHHEEYCAVMTRSRTSLTKEEIEEFWRKRQLAMEEHLKAATAQASGSQSEKVQYFHG